MVMVRNHTRRVDGHTTGVVKHERELSGKAGEFSKSNRMPKDRTSEIDHPLAEELKMAMQNDGNLYRQRIDPIIKNLAKKHKKGIYDSKLAQKLWMYAVTDYAKKYAQENRMNTINVPTRMETAKLLEEDYGYEIKNDYY